MARHLLIAGTGRAGTSVLVKLLTELGLDTHVSRHGAVSWSEEANAGLEDLILRDTETLPYVVKSPWLYEYIDEVLDRDDIVLDGVILPMRDLVEAATSRTILEYQNVHRTAGWMAEGARTWNTWATTPGGLVYSLSPVDEARLLAVGFHHLLERLVAAEVPVHFLTFPRFVHDPAYLHRALAGCLPATVTAADVEAAYARVVDTSKVRVGDEIGGRENGGGAAFADGYPGAEDMDNAALRREIVRLRKALAGSPA